MTSYNIIFKQRLLWSLGLQGGFRGGLSADNPFGVHEYRNVIGNQQTHKENLFYSRFFKGSD
ncbi:hypothetical protein CS562_09310 [Paenibacillus sp. LK1]|nr:hypothetical protein CS562_09310 [Paenibacillus sp. LK1]